MKGDTCLTVHKASQEQRAELLFSYISLNISDLRREEQVGV